MAVLIASKCGSLSSPGIYGAGLDPTSGAVTGTVTSLALQLNGKRGKQARKCCSLSSITTLAGCPGPDSPLTLIWHQGHCAGFGFTRWAQWLHSADSGLWQWAAETRFGTESAVAQSPGNAMTGLWPVCRGERCRTPVPDGQGSTPLAPALGDSRSRELKI